MKQCEILVVDDDSEDHLILTEYFRDAGKVECLLFLENGVKALEYLEASESSNLPKLIVLDLNMPILNGTQTLFKIKQNPKLKHIPVIIYSTSNNDHERRKCSNFGAVDYIVKPMTLEEGETMVKKFMTYVS